MRRNEPGYWQNRNDPDDFSEWRGDTNDGGAPGDFLPLFIAGVGLLGSFALVLLVVLL